MGTRNNFDGPENINLPYSEADWEKLGEVAMDLRKKYP